MGVPAVSGGDPTQPSAAHLPLPRGDGQSRLKANAPDHPAAFGPAPSFSVSPIGSRTWRRMLTGLIQAIGAQRTHPWWDINIGHSHGDISTACRGDGFLETGGDFLADTALAAGPLRSNHKQGNRASSSSRLAAFRRKNGVSTTVIGAAFIFFQLYAISAQRQEARREASPPRVDPRPRRAVCWGSRTLRTLQLQADPTNSNADERSIYNR